MEAKDEENFELMKKTIDTLLNFNCSYYSDNFIKRRLEVRLRRVNMDTYQNYILFLKKNREELDKLKKELTIHTTNFFRDNDFWFFFMKKVIPKLIESKKQAGKKNINIWSAGSSTGEEGLSIAICLRETPYINLDEFNIKIIGTDLDLTTVEKAKIGEYNNDQFKEMPEAFKKKYFDKVDEKYKAKKVIKDMVDFKVGNILLPNKPRGMDLIFCRNTVIYFDIEAKTKLYEDFYGCLNKNGFLMIGKTEILQGIARDIFNIFDSKERIYIKE